MQDDYSSQFKYLGELLPPLDVSEDFPQESHDHQDILTAYENSSLVSIETNSSGLWKIIIHRGPKKIIVGLDVNNMQARVLEPKLDYEETNSLLWNGVIVLPKKDKFVDGLLKIFENTPKVTGVRYENLGLEAAFSRIGYPSPSPFTPLLLRPLLGLQANLMEKEKEDEFFVSEQVLDLIHQRLRKSSLWFLDARELYFEISTQQGVKILARLGIRPHQENENAVFISEHLANNLLLEEDAVLIFTLVRVPIAKSLRLWIEDPVLRALPETQSKVTESLSNYVTFTGGTLLRLKDEDFQKEYNVAVLEVEGWEPMQHLHLSAVSTFVPSATKVEMQVIFDETSNSPTYNRLDALDVYRQLRA